jgi:hypothetical protein
VLALETISFDILLGDTPPSPAENDNTQGEASGDDTTE